MHHLSPKLKKLGTDVLDRQNGWWAWHPVLRLLSFSSQNSLNWLKLKNYIAQHKTFYKNPEVTTLFIKNICQTIPELWKQFILKEEKKKICYIHNINDSFTDNNSFNVSINVCWLTSAWHKKAVMNIYWPSFSSQIYEFSIYRY